LLALGSKNLRGVSLGRSGRRESEAMKPTIEDLTKEIVRLMDVVDNIRQMAESRKTVIRMADGMQLGNYCRQALGEANHTLEIYKLNPR
jgi:hypothetical protein